VASHRAAVALVHREWAADSAVAESAVTAADSRPEEVDLAVVDSAATGAAAVAGIAAS